MKSLGLRRTQLSKTGIVIMQTPQQHQAAAAALLMLCCLGATSIPVLADDNVTTVTAFMTVQKFPLPAGFK